MKFWLLAIFINVISGIHGQVDTSYIFNEHTEFGTLDIRLWKSPSSFYFLKEGETFSFRENGDGPTNTFLDMTAWDSSPYKEGHLKISDHGIENFVMNYRVLFPSGYDPNNKKGYPLVLVLHGLQESGNCASSKCYHSNVQYNPNDNSPPAPTDAENALLNNDYNLAHTGEDYVIARNAAAGFAVDDGDLPSNAFPGIVIFPQNLNGWDAASAEDAIRLLRLFVKNHNVDPNRIYINGISNGGRGAYEVMKRAPWMFAAGILFSAADDARVLSQGAYTRLIDIPLWIFQGETDDLPTLSQTDRYVSLFRKAGANIRYTVYKNVGHATWNKALAEPDFFHWMLRQQKNKIHPFANDPAICSTNGKGATLYMPQGFRDYQWSYDGSTIQNENRHQLTVHQPGTYRGRYKSGDDETIWSDWSDPISVSINNGEQAVLRQRGTVKLKDPNGHNEVAIHSESAHPYYVWLKDGKPLTGTRFDTSQQIILTPALGNGIYSLRVAGYDGCPGPESHKLNVFFNDSAPMNMPVPSSMSASGITASSATISWENNHHEANEYEIWRNCISNGDTSWALVRINSEDERSFTDNTLLPATTYNYKLRAVGFANRSDYSTTISATTTPDDITPTKPTDLHCRMTGASRITFEWKPATDNARVVQYLLISEEDTLHTNSDSTTYRLESFDINREYNFRVVAVDVGNNVSPPSNVARIYTRTTGLFYTHSTGNWQSLNDIDWNIFELDGVVPDFDLSQKTQDDFFNFRFDGYLFIKEAGVYQFRVTSNDGSRLFLDDSLFILNDGIHNAATITSPVHVISEGPHRITVDFFDSMLEDTLLIEYKGPDSNREWMKIQSNVLTSEIDEPEDSLTYLEDFSIYPNPTMGRTFKLSFKKAPDLSVTIKLMTTTGEIMFSENIPSNHVAKDFEITIPPHLNEGLYIFEIVQERQRMTKRVLLMDN